MLVVIIFFGAPQAINRNCYTHSSDRFNFTRAFLQLNISVAHIRKCWVTKFFRHFKRYTWCERFRAVGISYDFRIFIAVFMMEKENIDALNRRTKRSCCVQRKNFNAIALSCNVKIWEYPLLLSLSTPLYFHVFSSDFYDFFNVILSMLSKHHFHITHSFTCSALLILGWCLFLYSYSISLSLYCMSICLSFHGYANVKKNEH